MNGISRRAVARHVATMVVVVVLLLIGAAQLVSAAPPDSFTLSPGSLSITAEVGETRTGDIALTTRKPVVITTESSSASFVDTGAGSCWQTYLSQGLRIPGKVTCTIRVGFTSGSAGTFAGTLTVRQCTAWHADATGALVCDAVAGAQTVALTGTAAGQADLTVGNVAVTGSAGTLPFTWTATVSNVGDATLNVKNVAIAAAYSSDALVGGDTAACGGVVSSSNLLLTPGQGVDVEFWCLTPPPPGSAYLAVEVDGPNAVAESSETNNVSIAAMPTVDLIVDSITLEGATTTNRLNYTVRVKNIGTGTFVYGDSQNAAVVRGRLQGGPGVPVTAACQTLLLDTVFALAPGATLDLPIACDVAPTHGQDYLFVTVDAVNSVPEFDEANNENHVLLPEINLVALDVDLLGPDADSAYRYLVTYRLESTATLPVDVGSLLIGGAYSQNAISDALDNPACSLWTPARAIVDPGVPIYVTIECDRAPATTDRFLIVTIDAGSPDTIAESDEISDNAFAAPIPAVDLVVAGVRREPPNAGYSYSFTALIANVGYQAVDPSAVTVQGHYSANGALDSFDVPASAQTAGGTLAAFGTAEVLVNNSAAPRTLDRFLIATVDYNEAVIESDETNNDFALELPRVDLHIQAVTPTDSEPGVFRYDVVVENFGPNTLDASGAVVQGYFSADAVLDGADTPAGGSVLGAAGSALGAFQTATLPLATSATPGNYLIVVVDNDNTIVERDEGNNVAVIGLKPDLSVVSVSAIGAFAGDDFAWRAVIRNENNVPFAVDSSPLQIRLEAYRSTDAVLDAGDLLLAFCGTGLPLDLVLDPGETYTAGDGCSGGTPNWGSDYLIVKVDTNNVLAELDETNNAAAELLPDVDLVIQDVVIDSPQLAGFFGYNVTIRYDSTIPTDIGSVLVTGTYSADNVINFGDNPACSERVSADFVADPGQTVTLRILCDVLPSTSDFHLLVTVDASNDIHESDETNNVFDRSLIFVG